MIATITRTTTSVPSPMYIWTYSPESRQRATMPCICLRTNVGPGIRVAFSELSVGAPTSPTPPRKPRRQVVTGLLRMRRVLGLVDHLSGLVLHLLDHLFDLVLCVAVLLFGLTSLTIGLTFGFKILVADKASNCLFGLALHLLSLSSHCAPPFVVVKRGAAPTTVANALPTVAQPSRTGQRKRSSSSPFTQFLARTNPTDVWVCSSRQPPDIPEERVLRHLGQRRARRRPLSVVGAV